MEAIKTENLELIIEYQKNGQQEIFEQLFEQYKNLIRYMANKCRWMEHMMHCEFSDILQESYIIFHDSVITYDLNSEYKFTTYLCKKIQWGLYRLYDKVIKRHNKIDSEVILDELSLDYAIQESYQLYDVIPDPNSEKDLRRFIEEECKRQLENDVIYLVEKVFGNDSNDKTNQRMKNIVRLYFGIGCTKMTLEHLAVLFKCSATNIQLIRDRAINKIRRSPQGNKFMEKYKEEYFAHLIKGQRKSKTFDGTKRLYEIDDFLADIS